MKNKRFLLTGIIAGAIATAPLQGYAAENRWGIELEQDEKELLAKVLWHEAGNQPKEEQYKVVAVVLNRVIDGRFGGDTVEKVIMAPDNLSGQRNSDILNRRTNSLRSSRMS